MAEVDVFYTLSAEHFAEIHRRLMRPLLLRTGAPALVFLAVGLALRGAFGMFLFGVGFAYAAVVVKSALVSRNELMAIGHGRYAERRLVVKDGEALQHTLGGTTRLSADTVKNVARGKRVLFLDLDGGARTMIPLEVADAPAVRDELLAAIAQRTPTDALHR